jgi:hypothetical protein
MPDAPRALSAQIAHRAAELMEDEPTMHWRTAVNIAARRECDAIEAARHLLSVRIARAGFEQPERTAAEVIEALRKVE